MVGLSQHAHNECNAPELMEETPEALRVAVMEDDRRIQQLISAETTDEGHAMVSGRGFEKPSRGRCPRRTPGQPGGAVLPGQSTSATGLFKTASFDGNRRASPPEQLALPGRDHPLTDQTIERLIKNLRNRGWNQHPDQRETSQQVTRRLCQKPMDGIRPQGQRRQVSVLEPRHNRRPPSRSRPAIVQI